MNKKLTIFIVSAMLVALFFMSPKASAETVYVTMYYGNINIDGSFRWMPGSWNLGFAPVTVSYELDLTNAPNNSCNDWGGCPGVSHWSAGNVGLVWPGSEWAGAWMSGFLSDWDNKSTMFPTYPDNDASQELDDKFNMARSPYDPATYMWDERHYDVKCTTKDVVTEVGHLLSPENYGIWFDRDGVDEWQATGWGVVDGGTYNTGGVYQMEIVYDWSSSDPTSKGTACARFFPDLPNPLNQDDLTDDIYGIPTGFDRQADGSYLLFPYGISFDTDEAKMIDMQVFVSGSVYPGGTIVVRDLTVSGYLNLEEGMATGGGWFIPEDDKVHGISLGGKATFGFVAKQKKGTSSGQLEFQYHVDDLNLKSDSYDWVNLATTQVMFEGIGTLNGEYGHKFRVRAVDGDKIGTNTDRFEIRIWTDGGTWEMPTYRAEGDLSGGQIVVHKK